MKLVGQIIRADEKIWNKKKNGMSTLYDAKVPIIKLYFGDGTKIDIQFCNYHTLKNTNLLRYYATSDPRYRKVYIYVKNLLSCLNLLDGEKGLLTSCQISVLVAHFLQKPFKNQKPILPIIPQVCSSFVSPNLSIEEVIENLSKPVDISRIQPLINRKPLASHLAIQFVDYFAEFDFSSYAILMNKADPVEIFPVDLLPKLRLFDLYSNKSISNGDRALEALSVNLKYVRNSIKEGYFIDNFLNSTSFNNLKKIVHMQNKLISFLLYFINRFFH
uniref:PAP-associated domain-containing protein n=1 Tax=Strongyloides papillosus TaxID=174720 RepID=A0A0N5B4A1_STREA